jgi:hypothetical protein
VFISAVICGFAKSDTAHTQLTIILTINPEVIFIPKEVAQVYQIRKSLARKLCHPVLQNTEPVPHAAGSYHNPEQHAIYMKRIDAMLTTPPGNRPSNA